jgi:hypothetical protein
MDEMDEAQAEAWEKHKNRSDPGRKANLTTHRRAGAG